MPIFMDRHDVSDSTTAENVARLHQEDLKIQHEFGCRGLTYWFDDQRKTAFCLIEASYKEDILKMHQHAHGQVPHKVIEVDPGVVESFLGRIEDPEKAGNTALNIISDSAFRVMMVIRSNSPSPKAIKPLQSSLSKHIDLIAKVVSENKGNIVKKDAERLIAVFTSVTGAVSSALAINTTLRTTATDNVSAKIVITAGVPVTDKQSIFEDALCTAQRLADTVRGEIIVSSEVKNLYRAENSTALKNGNGIRCLSADEENLIYNLFDYAALNWPNTQLTIDDLSKAMGRSRSQLYRTVTTLTGQSPNTFLNEYRLNEAFRLLGEQTKNVSEVAFECGFSSVSYFSKCFQKKYGNLPSEVLRHHRQ
jgi:AraC-like DNA-binding protein